MMMMMRGTWRGQCFSVEGMSSGDGNSCLSVCI